MALHHNIGGELTQELLAVGGGIDVQKISITNTHASITCTVDLYIEKKLTGTFYLIKGVAIPVGATFIYQDGVRFTTKVNQFSLYIKLTQGASEIPSVDVIIS